MCSLFKTGDGSVVEMRAVTFLAGLSWRYFHLMYSGFQHCWAFAGVLSPSSLAREGAKRLTLRCTNVIRQQEGEARLP